MEKHPNVFTLHEVTLLINQETDTDVLSQLTKILGIAAAQDFKKTLPLLVKYLSDSRKNVREGMISGMVELSTKVPMNVYVPSLLPYFGDGFELILQQSIALLLRRILRYESEELKKRVIPMLKIRAEVTQDSILAEVLSDLQVSLQK